MDNPPAMQHVVGWAASGILLATIASQVYRQWKERTSKGVSRWLFIGQIAASAGFVVYSWMVKNTVFIVTNILMLLSAVMGLVIVLRHRRNEDAGEGEGEAGEAPAEPMR
jgi:MtN3 and saliva related transmembrane protein